MDVEVTPEILRAQIAALENFAKREQQGKKALMQPKFTDDPEAWELYWRHVDRFTSGRQISLFRPGELGAGGPLATYGTEENLWRVEKHKNQLCRLIGTTMRHVLSLDDVPEFIPKWRSLSRQRRKQLVCFGFFAAEDMTTEAGYRGFCPELTFDWLVDGPGFPSLLNALVESAVLNPANTDFREIVNEQFDRFEHIKRGGMDHQVSRAAKCYMYTDVLRRHLYMTSFLMGVLLSTFVKPITPLPEELSLLESLPEDVDPALRRKLESFQAKVDAELEVASYADKVVGCCRCLRVDVFKSLKLPKPKNSTFAQCSKCIAVGRRVAYCSRACQVDDYARHKVVCGKNISEILPAPAFLPAAKPPMAVAVRRQLVRQVKPTLYHVFAPSDDGEGFVSDALFLPSEKEHLWDDFHRDFEAMAYFSDSKENRLKLAALVLFIAEHAEPVEEVTEADIVRQFSRDFDVDKKKLKKAVREKRG